MRCLVFLLIGLNSLPTGPRPLLRSCGISTIHGGQDVGKEREHDCMDAGGSAMQEQLPRSGSFACRDVGKGREQERKLLKHLLCYNPAVFHY